MTTTRRLLLLPALAMLAAACSAGGPGTAGSPTADVAVTAVPAPATSAEASAAPGSPAAPDPGGAAPGSPATPGRPATPGSPATPPQISPAAQVLDQAWATAELTDVATGQPFRLADLAGRTVILETMAIWCSNCLAQQGHVYEALAELDPQRVAYVLLDIDPNETAEALAQYRDRHGFTGTYAVASQDVARALADEFGDQVLNPPSTPMILIGTDGRTTLAPFGSKSSSEIVDLARDHGA